MATSSTSLAAQIQAAANEYGATLTKPITALQSQKTLLSYRTTSLNSIRTKMSAMSLSTNAMMASGGLTKFAVYSVSSTNADAASASATTGESVGTHTLSVSQLAKNDMTVSSRFSNDGASIAAAVGAGAKQFTIGVNGVDTTVDVTLTGAETNAEALKAIAAAVTAKLKTSGVTASVIGDTPTTSKLIFSAQSTGSANAITLSDAEGGNVLDAIGLTESVLSARTAATASEAGYSYSDPLLLDAKFTLDGISLVRSGNTVADALPGLTLTLKSTQAAGGAPVTLTVGLDKAAIKANVQDFLSKYNELIAVVRSQTAIDTEAKTRQVLSEDATYIQMRTSLRQMVLGEVATAAAGNPTSLTAIGITSDAEGKLSITDAAKFDQALAGSSPAAVSDLFTSTGGVAAQMKAKMDAFLNAGGIMALNTKSIADRTKAIDKKIAEYTARNNRKIEQYKNDLAKVQTMLSRLSTQTTLASTYLSQVGA